MKKRVSGELVVDSRRVPCMARNHVQTTKCRPFFDDAGIISVNPDAGPCYESKLNLISKHLTKLHNFLNFSSHYHTIFLIVCLFVWLVWDGMVWWYGRFFDADRKINPSLNDKIHVVPTTGASILCSRDPPEGHATKQPLRHIHTHTVF